MPANDKKSAQRGALFLLLILIPFVFKVGAIAVDVILRR